jgi:hypothetical protein
MVNKYCAVHGNRKFNSVLTRLRHWSLSWATLIQYTPSHPASLRPVGLPNLMTIFLYSHYPPPPPPDNLPKGQRPAQHLAVILVFRPQPNPQACHPLLTAAANSIYSQLLSTSGSRLLHPQPEVHSMPWGQETQLTWPIIIRSPYTSMQAATKTQ